MIRLRTILLSNKPYYIIFAIAIIYFLIINNFITFKSKYDDLTTFTGIITNIEIKDYGFKLYIKNKEKIIAYYYLEKEEIKEITNSFSLGDTININCKELVINNNTIENTFNYKRYLYNQKIFHVVEITNIKLIKQNTNIFYELKNILLKRSIKLSKSYSYINSLLFGNNAFLESDVLESYRSNGISHLFAISGLHISIFVSIFEKVLKKFKVRENKRYISIIIFLIFYMFLTNFSMSILRAAIFTILGIINKIFYFYIKPANLLLLTLAIIIFINPLYLFNIGLQFSFLISLYLIIYSNLINNCKSKLLMTSLISFFVSLPIVINNFYQVNFLSIIYNIFFVPYVSLIILPLTLIVYVLPFLDSILYILLYLMEKVSLLINNINLGKVIFCKANLLFVVNYYLILSVSLQKLKYHKKKFCWILILLIFIWFLMPFSKENYYLSFDVGQGDSTLFYIDKKIVLIDTGGVVMYNDSKYKYNIAKNILLYLKSKGIRKVDHLILTHGDADHMMESTYIINNFKVGNIYLNSNKLNYLETEVYNLAVKKNINIKFLEENDYINIGKYKINSLNKNRKDENDSSIVLYTNINNNKVLITGDISKNIELDIINKYNLENLNIIKLAHHGSNTSNDYEFLKKTNPNLAIISASLNNKYNHPSKETIDNLKKLNIKYLETSKVGSIKINLDDGTKILYEP